MRDLRILASDKFEGRAACSVGEDLTVAYLIKRFKEAGVSPGNPDGTYVQNVPLVGFLSEPKLTYNVNGKRHPLKFPDEYFHEFPALKNHVSAKGLGVVFVGFGIEAKEYGWDDFKDTDLNGKLVFVLGSEPRRPAPSNPKAQDPTFFKGENRTTYSIRANKVAALRKRGAKAVFVISTLESPNSFRLFQTFALLEGFALPSKTDSGNELVTTGVIHFNAAKRLFSAAGLDLSDLKKQANSPSFLPVSLDARADISVTSKLRKAVSRNVVGLVRGSDPQLRKEFVILSAHWDHLGRDPKRKGDQIFNGAIDNAIGVAQLLELARALANLKIKPKRSILFIGTAAEEKGWLGSRYYLQNPLYPLSSHVANINLDGGNAWGPTRDVITSGFGLSTLDTFLERAAQASGRKFTKENIDDNSLYFGSDQIEFAKAGIPAAFPFSGFEYIGKSKEFGDRKWESYSDHDYHRVSDEVRSDWDLKGAVEDCRWFATTTWMVANSIERPKWLPNAGFGNQPLVPIQGTQR